MILDILCTALMVPMGDPVHDPSNCKMGLPTILWGVPGIGKSYRTEYISARLGLPYEVIFPATRQPEDASGAAIPTGKGGVKFVSLLPGVSRLIQNKEGVLILDELSCARPAVQAAFLGVILDRRVGDEVLPPGIRILAAANDAEDAAGGWELEPPMANRLCHIDTPTPTDSEWVSWLLNEDIEKAEPMKDAQKQLVGGWTTAWNWVRALRAGYGRVNQSSTTLINIPKPGDPQRGKGWPSPRSWTMALRAMATCKIFGMSDKVMHAFVVGCIGPGVGVEFLTWVRKADLPTAEEAIRDGWEPDTRRLDRTVAVYSSVAMYVTGLKQENAERAFELEPAVWSLLQQGWDAGVGDTIVGPVERLIQAGLYGSKSPEASKISTKLFSNLVNNGFHQFLMGRRP